jgi:GT2 family glycosyltransferase
MKKMAIIIVNWNGVKFLQNCLTAVYAQTYQQFDVYFVDNGSKDNSVQFVGEYFPRVKIIRLENNTGFAKGSNEGIKKALEDSNVQYIVCLNNDTIVSPEWLMELVKTAEKSEKIGAVSSKAYFDDKVTIQNAGLDFSSVLQINRLGGLSVGFGKTDEEIPSLSTDKEVFAAGGVAPLYKRIVVERLLERDGEFFDEDFFAYVEDYDVGFRIRNLGYISMFSARARLVHLHSKTGGVASPFKTYYSERNAVLAGIKNLPPIDVFLFPLRNLYLKLSYFFIKNESVEKLKGNIGISGMLWILIKANFSAFLLIPKFVAKRWKI